MRITFVLALPTDSSSVPVVRGLCRTNLEQLGVRDDCIDDIALAVTEACANVVEHADNDEQFEVRVEIEGTRCRIHVVDTGGGFDPGSYSLRSEESLLEGGRGIGLMRRLVDGLHFAPDEAGTTVTLDKRLELQDDSPLVVV